MSGEISLWNIRFFFLNKIALKLNYVNKIINILQLKLF
jgi:hypothetical protein